MTRWLVRLALAALAVTGAAGGLGAAACQDMTFEGTGFTVCEADPRQDRLALFLHGPDGSPFGHFGTLDAALAERGQRLGFAMNAGMYHADRSPVGLYIENGTELRGVVSRAGPGNFGLLPNGVFCLRAGRADVFETLAFVEAAPACDAATQSGPMLVIDGVLHPRFLPDSTSRYVRNGVGTSADGHRTVFAISNAPVTFHTFGRFFRDVLRLPNALYLDGNVSRLRAPDLGRSDFGFTDLGPIIGVVETR